MVRNRIGEDSYEVEVKPGRLINTKVRFLKPWQGDSLGEPHLPLFFHQQTTVDEDAEPTDWIVQEIVDHKIENGQKFFKVLWEGFPPDEATWEGVGSFLTKVNEPWRKYCEHKGIIVDLISEVSKE